IQPPGATFFVTFRLAGSLPQIVLARWNEERQWLAHLERDNPSYHASVKLDFERRWFTKFESLLDGATSGPVWLREDRIAAIVAESLHYRHRKKYRLDAFSIMPNHVHSVVKPLPILGGEEQVYHSMASIKQSLKGTPPLRPIVCWVAKERFGHTRVMTIGFGMMSSGSGQWPTS